MGRHVLKQPRRGVVFAVGRGSVSAMGGFTTAAVLAAALCLVTVPGTDAHIDQDDLTQQVHHQSEVWYDRPSPPPPTFDESLIGGLYQTPLLLRENTTYEMMCSVIIKHPGFLYIAPNVTINVRPDCEDYNAFAWSAGNPGGVGMKPSIIVLPGARLEVRATSSRPSVIRKLEAGVGYDGTSKGDWGGIYMFGRARVSFDPEVGGTNQNGGEEGEHIPVGTAPGADAGPVDGLPISQRFVARKAPEGTFNFCDNSVNPHGLSLPSCEDIMPSLSHGDGNHSGYTYFNSRFEYGGDDDGGSCGEVEHLIVVNGGGLDTTNWNPSLVPTPVAVGLYGCGAGTSIKNLEVAHSGGVGLELNGGAALVKDVAVWATASDAITAKGGYRGVLKNAFVDVDGDEDISALRVSGDWVSSGSMDD